MEFWNLPSAMQRLILSGLSGKDLARFASASKASRNLLTREINLQKKRDNARREYALRRLREMQNTHPRPINLKRLLIFQHHRSIKQLENYIANHDEVPIFGNVPTPKNIRTIRITNKRGHKFDFTY